PTLDSERTAEGRPAQPAHKQERRFLCAQYPFGPNPHGIPCRQAEERNRRLRGASICSFAIAQRPTQVLRLHRAILPPGGTVRPPSPPPPTEHHAWPSALDSRVRRDRLESTGSAD